MNLIFGDNLVERSCDYFVRNSWLAAESGGIVLSGLFFVTFFVTGQRK